MAPLRGGDDRGDVLQLRRGARGGGAGARRAAPACGPAAAGQRAGGDRRVLRAAGGARGAPRLRSAVLGAPAESHGRHPGPGVTDLGGPPAQLSPYGDDLLPDVGDRGGGAGPAGGYGPPDAAWGEPVGDGGGRELVCGAGGADVPVLAGVPARLRAAQPDHVDAGPGAGAGVADLGAAAAARRGGGGADRRARAAGDPGRSQLWGLSGAVADGHRARPGGCPAGGLHRLLSAGRADGLPVLRRHRRGRGARRPALGPAGRPLGRGDAVRRAVRDAVAGCARRPIGGLRSRQGAGDSSTRCRSSA